MKQVLLARKAHLGWAWGAMVFGSLLCSTSALGSSTQGKGAAVGFVEFQSEAALQAFLSLHPNVERVHPALLWVKGPAGQLEPLTGALPGSQPGFSPDDGSAESLGVVQGSFARERKYVIPTPQFSLNSDDLPRQLWGISRIQAPAVWAQTQGSPDVIVAVLDTGIDFKHEALRNQLAFNPAERDGQAGQDDDGNGLIDDVYGYDFINRDSDPSDDQGHGSHVSGTIAGLAPERNFYGVAPGVRLLTVKTHNRSGEGSEEAVVKGILYAVDQGAKVINCSWGGAPEAPDHSALLYDAIRYANEKGVTLVAAAGNDRANNDKVKSYPANYDLPNVISVAASNSGSSLAFFSNYGVKKVHLAAPGANIYSVRLGGRYTTNSGTSMAAPHVAGAAALVYSARGTQIKPQEIRDLFVNNAEKFSGLADKLVAGGVLNLKFLLVPFTNW